MTIARPNAAFHAVGHALDRVDGPAKVTGSMGYTAGITLPGMPLGSPGMTGSKQGPFTIYAIAQDGAASVFMTL